jgi:DNA-binding response OmpR family regulator
MNVLIVEDCKVMQLMIKRALNISNLEIDEIYLAENGLEGMDVINKSDIDLLILDMNMPVMNGMEMLEILRSHSETEGVTVLVVSTESNEKRVESMMKLGDNFVHKPFTPEQLIAELHNLGLKQKSY